MKFSDITSGIIAHQVNCLGYMGCGIALAIRNQFPNVYESYRRFGHRTGDGRWQLGMCQIVDVNDNLSVANLAGQFGIGRQHRMTDYTALAMALTKLATYVNDSSTHINGRQVYFPHRMGCGNAGGDWAIVKSMIVSVFPDAIFFTK